MPSGIPVGEALSRDPIDRLVRPSACPATRRGGSRTAQQPTAFLTAAPSGTLLGFRRPAPQVPPNTAAHQKEGKPGRHGDEDAEDPFRAVGLSEGRDAEREDEGGAQRAEHRRSAQHADAHHQAQTPRTQPTPLLHAALHRLTIYPGRAKGTGERLAAPEEAAAPGTYDAFNSARFSANLSHAGRPYAGRQPLTRALRCVNYQFGESRKNACIPASTQSRVEKGEAQTVPLWVRCAQIGTGWGFRGGTG
jgi:hypothetical protein